MNKLTQKTSPSSRSRRSRHRHPTRRASLPAPFQLLAWAARLVVLVVLVALPWHYGSVHWSDQWWLVLTTAVVFPLALLIAVQRKQAFVPKFAIAACGFLLLAALQTLPLPVGVWSAVAPTAGFLNEVQLVAGTLQRATDNDGESPSQNLAAEQPAAGAAPPVGMPAEWTPPTTLSIHPAQTRASLAVFACGLAFLLSVRILFDEERTAGLLFLVVCVTSVAVALLGLYQRVSYNNVSLLPMHDANHFATFVSRNSAPQFFAIGFGATLSLLAYWVSVRKPSSEHSQYNVRYPAANLTARIRRRLEDLVTDLDPVTLIAVLGLILLFVVTFAAASRGGMLACLGAIMITTIASLGRMKSMATAAIGAVLLGGTAFILLTSLELDQRAVERLGTVFTEVESGSNTRYLIWKHAVSEPAYWLFGSGLGTFHFAFPGLSELHLDWAYHAENIYIEAFTEFGFIGLLLLFVVLGWIVHDLRRQRSRWTKLAVVYALSAIALQSLVDFSLILPSIFLPLAAILGCHYGLNSTLDHRSQRKRSTRRASLDWCVVVGILACMALGLWDLQGFVAGEQVERMVAAQEQQLRVRGVAANGPELQLQLARLYQRNVELEVRDSALWGGTDEEVLSKFCRAELVAGAIRNHPQSQLTELRTIVEDTPQLVEQLEKSALGSRLASQACPYDWRASWSVLRSDAGQLSPTERALNYARLACSTHQNPSLQCRVATTALLSGDHQIGFWLWQDILSDDQRWAVAASRLVPQTLSGDELVTLLAHDPVGLAKALRSLQRREPEEFAALIGSISSEQLNAAASKLEDWELVAWVAAQQGNLDEQLDALRKTAQLAPQDVAVRIQLARLLMEQDPESMPEALSDALQYAQQAVMRSPGNEKAKQLMADLKELSAE